MAITIQSLPPELLQIVFKLIHGDLQQSETDFTESFGLFEDVTADLSHANSDSQQVVRFVKAQTGQFLKSKVPQFPHTFASVCRTWENVMSASPEFWTRLALFIGSSATPCQRLRDHLAWSRHLPIDIFITRRCSYASNDPISERKAVKTYVELLQPHMARCRTLSVEVRFNSSLPSLMECVPNNSPLLKTLRLAFTVHNPVAPIRPSVEEDFCGIESFPQLRMMAIDGKTFHDAYTDAPTWFELQPELKHIAISNFNNPDIPLSLSRTLYMIDDQFVHKLTSLTLSRLNFLRDISPDTPDHTYIFHGVTNLHLEEIEGPVIADMFRLCNFGRLDFLRIQNCLNLDKKIFDSITSPVSMLVLDANRNITDATDENVVEFLSGWRGYFLGLMGTTGGSRQHRSNAILSALAEPGVADPEVAWQANIHGGKYFIAPNLQALVMTATTVPSFSAIKKFVEARGHYIDYKSATWRATTHFGPAISQLFMIECWNDEDSMPFSEGKEWLQEKVPFVSWEQS